MLNGHLLNERYKIKESIGGGGMADVYLATDTILDRDVAIKALRMDFADDEEFIARFDREAQSAASLAHPNIVNIYDVGEDDRVLFMAMEYVDGMTLKEYIQRYAPIDTREALDIMKQIASAIAHAHANDIIHRDIKPQNIMIDTYGQVKVTDFGIAVALSATALTQTNSILGSVHYLSPEQARGGTATKKSDIYSLGIVLFELLTGRLPFSGQSPVSIALKHLQNDTPSVKRFNPNIPQSVENIVLKATAKDPFHRYDTVYDMEDTLESALSPDRLNEEKFIPPAEEGEETKAIPIITDNQLDQNTDDDTIVNQPNEATKPYMNEETDENDKGTKKGKKKKNKKKKTGKQRRKKWLLILASLFLLLGATAVALFIFPGWLQPNDVDVPDVSGMAYEEAMSELQELNLETERDEAYSDDVEENTVIGTEPEAGSTITEDDTVTLIVSQGQEEVAFEDYVGENVDQVRRILENKGFETITTEEEYSNEYAAGEIVSHVYPSPGTEVIPEETEVIFDISIGPAPINVNNLTGMSEQQAINSLEEQGLNAAIREENSENTPEGNVIRQDPEPGTEVEAGNTVDVFISTGPEEKPPVNHEETFTVSYNPSQEEDTDDPVEQTVSIYIGDNNRSISEVHDEYTITEDREFTITLTIAPDSVAEYRVMRNEEVIIDKSIPYEEAAGD
ncbi:Stk1 family PASTA domain-containing Ser/Thr kinase [Lentibacillus sp. CBA3610]|uniref:Stk1 family PASTA domain-containing Ser/Thr kinase n=1 Tax=Lentibacillus sp. CBA3610 TaxID=2518176 RepID=UPI001595A61F|nr:Stk1 family PASTA domain-containing Ser/Thr kinase [Lentibacillus sp. CBA3610]QKY68991.1 Stk1 family PASTA domain-containing Ser/Thr kinase [Lentibacillus sp. CBA3610]